MLSLGMEYSQKGLEISSDHNLFSVFIKTYFINKDYVIISIISLFGLISSLVKFRSKDHKYLLPHLIFIFLLGVTLYSIYTPRNNFFHYSILLWPVFYFYVSCAFDSYIQIEKNIIFLIVFILCIQLYDLKFRQFYPIHKLFSNNLDNNPIQEERLIIEKYTSKNDCILVWGWKNSLYLKPLRKRSSGFLYPSFAFGYNNSDFVSKNYFDEINYFKPKLIIEAIGDNQFFFNDSHNKSISACSNDLAKLISLNYKVLIVEGSLKIFIRID
jgi:hypothetical protein